MRQKRSVRNRNSLMYKLKGAKNGNYLPCDPKIFQEGEVAMIFHGPRSFVVEVWVQRIARASGQKVGWNIAGGRAIVRYLGDGKKVAETIDFYLPVLKQFTKQRTRSDLIIY